MNNALYSLFMSLISQQMNYHTQIYTDHNFSTQTLSFGLCAVSVWQSLTDVSRQLYIGLNISVEIGFQTDPSHQHDPLIEHLH